MSPESDARTESTPAPAPAPSVSSAYNDAPPDYDAMIAEAVAAAEAEAVEIRAAETASAEGGTAREAASPVAEPATPARPSPDAEPGRGESTEEEGSESADDDVVPEQPGTDPDLSLADRLREAGLSRSQRRELHALIAAREKAAEERAAQQARAATETAERLQREADARAQEEQRQTANLGAFLGDDDEFARLQSAYDRDELWGDEKARYLELRERRSMVPVLTRALWARFDRDLRVADEIEGVEKGLWDGTKVANLGEYTRRVATGAASAAAAKVRAELGSQEATWKARHEDLEATIEERDATIASLQAKLAAAAPAPLAGGRAATSPSADSLLQSLIQQAGGEEAFFERAERGDYASLNLTGS